VTKGFTFISDEGVFIRVEETTDREGIVLSLTRNGRVETAWLNKAQWEALVDLKYKVDVYYPKARLADGEPVEPPTELKEMIKYIETGITEEVHDEPSH
jgi:hypothetical protein